jgi:hypothetical protein
MDSSFLHCAACQDAGSAVEGRRDAHLPDVGQAMIASSRCSIDAKGMRLLNRYPAMTIAAIAQSL